MTEQENNIRWLVLQHLRQEAGAFLSINETGDFVLERTAGALRQSLRGQERALLTFDSAAPQRPDRAEFVGAGHPIIEAIRNRLLADEERSNPRVGCAHAPVLLEPAGRVSFLGGHPISGRVYIQSQEVAYRLVFWFNYSVQADVDYHIPVAVDAVTSKILEVPSNLIDRFYLDGPPPDVDGESSLAQFDSAIATGNKAVTIAGDRVKHALSTAAEARIQEETERLNQAFENEKSSIDAGDSAALEMHSRRHERALDDLAAREQVLVRIELSSVLMLWFPVMRFSCEGDGKSRRFSAGSFVFDALEGRLAPGDGGELRPDTRFEVCEPGHHLHHATGTEDVAPHDCAVCGTRFCPEHGGGCAGCVNAVCTDDSKACDYHDNDAVRFCPSCRRESYDGGSICLNCGTTCVQCHRLFPEELTDSCRMCGQTICLGHALAPDGASCAECGETACREDGVNTAAGTWVCNDHSVTVQCCGLILGRSQVLTCAICHTGNCAQHATMCQTCQKSAVCAAHQGGLTACDSCGRGSCGIDGCSSLAEKCRHCGMAYCMHCISREICTTCSNLRRAGYGGALRELVKGLSNSPDEALRKFADTCCREPDRVKVLFGENGNQQVFSVRYEPPFYWVFSKATALRIVVTKESGVIRSLVWESLQ